MNPQFSSYSNRGIQISLYISFVTSPVEIDKALSTPMEQNARRAQGHGVHGKY